MRRTGSLGRRGPRLAALLLAGLLGCGDHGPEMEPARPLVFGGDAELGHSLISEYGCGSCHFIPGVRGAEGLVGPPLANFGLRAYIAGNLANTPENLVTWIVDPQAVEPGTAMPTLGVTESAARHIAAYLYTLP